MNFFCTYIYMYVCMYIYTPYITYTPLQIHQQRCMLPQDWAARKKGFHHLVPLSHTLLWCLNKGTFSPDTKHLPVRKNFLIPLFLVHTIDYFPWKKWNMMPTSQGIHSSFVLAHISGALHFWVTYPLDTGENEVEYLINWLVCTGMLSDPILHCWG